MSQVAVELPGKGMQGCFINGAWELPAHGGSSPVENPSTREVLGNIGSGDAADVDLAVAAATAALPSWRNLPARERGAMLHSLGDLVEQHKESIATLLAAETGNAIRTQSRGEVQSAADVLRYCGGIASEIKGETIPLGSNLISYSEREPVGVVGAIIPWNSPFVLAAVKLGMALVTGNTFILKPAEDAPLAVVRLAELAAPIFPPGVFNLISGTGMSVGAALANHPRINKVTFTGSSPVGVGIAESAAGRLAHVTLELGGKSPCIVLPDQDTQQTANEVVAAMRFARQGQSCTAGSRLFVHESIWDTFLPKVENAITKLVVGDALDESSDVGAVINARRLSAINEYIREAVASGATVHIGGEAEEGPNTPLRAVPTLLSGLDNSWKIAQEEVFGPVLVAMPWSDESEVIGLANDTHFGLAAYIFSSDIDTALRMSRSIDAGWIQINRSGGQIPGMSYGGVKGSGYGREYSLEGALEAYTTRKSITIQLKDAPAA